jgi:multicomponent Na+:H+ antiporter subunit C
MLEHLDAWLHRPNFIVFVIIFLWGLYILVVHHNLVKKLIGMYLVQTSVIFFLVTLGVKSGSTVPVLLSTTEPIRVEAYANPLPHVVTLTAIVVGVAVLGVSLALVTAVYRKYGTLNEDEILKRLE